MIKDKIMETVEVKRSHLSMLATYYLQITPLIELVRIYYKETDCLESK